MNIHSDGDLKLTNKTGMFIAGVVVICIIAIISSVFLYLQTTNLQTQVSSLQSEATTLTNINNALESQVTTLQSEETALNNDKTALESQVTNLQSEIASLENDKVNLESQVSSLQSEIISLENEKLILETEISAIQSEKLTLETQISSLQSDVISLESEVVQSFNLGYAEGESEGHQLGYDEGYVQGVEDGAGRGWNIRDPTYNEAMSFINSDKTNENKYTDDYVCWNFVADFKNNAFESGYRAGDVYVEFVDSAHAITCFNTTDGGLIFIEPQDDQIVTLTIGEPYWDRTLYEPDYDDTIVKFTIIW